MRLVDDEPGPAAGRARLPVDGRGRRRRARRCSPRRGGRLIACEGLDARIVDLVRAKGSAGAGAAARAPAGCSSRSPARTRRRWPRRSSPRSGALGHRVGRPTPPRRPRCGGSARTAPAWPRAACRRPAYSGWEDAAVPPERLGAWLRDFDELLREHGLDGVPYGHFGDGCVHVRIDFPFAPGDAGVGPGVPRLPHRLRAQAARARRLAVRRARRRPGPLRAAAADVRRRVAARSSPRSRRSATRDNLLNPGNLVDPAPLDADLRPVRPRLPVAALLRLVHDGGSWATRCTAAPASASASRRRPTA